MKKIGIIIGHSSRSQGARAYNGVSEYNFNLLVQEFILRLSRYNSESEGQGFYLCDLDRNNGWDKLVQEVEELELDATIELHFNSFKKAVRGVECLHINGGASLATHIAVAVGSHYESKLRGDDGRVLLDRGDRGSYNLYCMAEAGVKESIIVEPCFANFETEQAKKIIGNPLEYANVLYKSIESYFRGNDEN